MSDQGIVQCESFPPSLDPLKSEVSAETLGFVQVQAYIPPAALSVAVATLGRRSQ